MINEPIPLNVLLRDLNCPFDKNVLKKIWFDCPDNTEMKEALSPRLELAKMIDTKDALDYIVKRGAPQAFIRDKRIF